MVRKVARARVVALRCEHLENPLGLDERLPRFSWQMRDARTGARQTAYELVVEKLADVSDAADPVWSSGVVSSDQTVLVPYGGTPLRPHTRYRWRVRLHDHERRASAWSEWAHFRSGFLGTKWPADWIGGRPPMKAKDAPVVFFRHICEIEERPLSALLYVTALGLVEPRLNGEKIGDDWLTPGWTDYRRRVEYLTYDVTGRVRAGRNVLGALLAEGWYSGRLLWEGLRWLYGRTPALRVALRVVLPGGGVRWIGTSRAWKMATGPFLSASLYNGERYDARRELAGWEPARLATVPEIEINGKQAPPIRASRELHAVAMREPKPGVFIYDLGQNMVGVVRLRVRAAAGTKIRLRYGEMLNADGTLYTANLRSAVATDEYTCRGGGETYTPRFTFHGFRYVEVTGLARRPDLDSIVGIVLQSDLPVGGHFRCSDRLINRLQQNIVWGQRGNFLDVPTDCPQRDERLGWTGDAQIFLRTAAFNLQVATFFRKWLRDLRDGQNSDGSFPDVAPDAIGVARRNARGGNAAWADAGVIVPWGIYQHYADTRVLEENYAAMCAWAAYQERTSKSLIRPATAYGDWLATDAVTPSRAPTPCDLIGTAYFAYTTRLVAATARRLSRVREAGVYEKLHGRIVAAFQHMYVSPGGRLAGDTQTSYALALAFDLLPPALRPRAVARLVELIERHGNRLSTGFVGTPLLCPVLSRFGRDDVAYRLLFQREYPSWLYPVLNGATTMWERWNSWTKESGFGDAGMNSFNHYAYGAIGEWLYAKVGGIALDPEHPGFERVLLQPALSARLNHAEAMLASPHGEIRSAWRLKGRRLRWEVTLPPNTRGSVRIPASGTAEVRINGKLLRRMRSWEFELPAGRYSIEVSDAIVHRY